MKDTIWKLNTSNLGKFEEFKRLFLSFGKELESSHIDLQEIDADPLLVMVHKASQFQDKVLVEDSSLDIEGAVVGIHVRALLDQLDRYVGKRALWTVLLGYRENNEVLIFKGAVPGLIVNPRGTQGFGFDPVFLPDGSTKTLGEEKPDAYNARAKAVSALMSRDVFAKKTIMEEWKGPWQK